MKKLLLIVCAVICSVSLVSAAQGKVSGFFKSYDWTPKYKSEVNAGFAMTGSTPKFNTELRYAEKGSGVSESSTEVGSSVEKTNFSRLFVETIHGFQFDKYLFVGAGAGLQYYTGKLHNFSSYAEAAATINENEKVAKRWNGVTMPIFANVRFMYPVKEDLVPFINLGLGGTACFGSSINAKYSEQHGEPGSQYDVELKMRLRGGFYCDFGGGVRWKQWNFSIGVQSQGLKVVVKSTNKASYEASETFKAKTTSNSFYLKAGWCF